MLSIESPEVPRGQTWKRKQAADYTGWHPTMLSVESPENSKFKIERKNSLLTTRADIPDLSRIIQSSKELKSKDLPADNKGWHSTFQQIQKCFKELKSKDLSADDTAIRKDPVRFDIALCGYPLKLATSQVLKSKGPVFAQFWSKFKNFNSEWWKNWKIVWVTPVHRDSDVW